MRKQLSQLEPGTRFLVPDLQIIGTLLTVTPSAAKVALDRPMREVEFTDPATGERRSFIASRPKTTTWAPNVSVLVISPPDPEHESDHDMTKKAAAKSAKPTRGERELKKRQQADAKAKQAAAKATKALRKPKPAKAPREPKAAKEPKAKRASALDAAFLVLKSNGGPMTCQAMIDEMAARKLWSSPGGKTPAATLYAAIGREIANKGAEARFEKIERGTFKAK